MAVKKAKQIRKSNAKPAAKTKSKATVKKASPTVKMPAIKDPLSKNGMIKTITDVAGVNRKEVIAVLDCLSQVIKKHVVGPGVFVMPGLIKIKVVKKAARPARKGVNPFTGEEIMIKAKPAYKTLKIKALKGLKEMVA